MSDSSPTPPESSQFIVQPLPAPFPMPVLKFYAINDTHLMLDKIFLLDELIEQKQDQIKNKISFLQKAGIEIPEDLQKSISFSTELRIPSVQSNLIPKSPYYVRKFLKKPAAGTGKGGKPGSTKRKLQRKDIYTDWSGDESFFYSQLKMHVIFFDELYEHVKLFFINSGMKNPIPTMTIKNQLMLICTIFGQNYTNATLGHFFGVGGATITRCVQNWIPILCEVLNKDINFDDLFETENWSEVDESVVGIVDATHDKIERPTANQKYFFRKDKNVHSEIAQVIVNMQGIICSVKSGFPGSFNDQKVLAASGVSWKGYGLLADGGYKFREIDQEMGRLFTPDNCRGEVKYLQKAERVLIEIVIGFIKRFRCVGTQWHRDTSLLKYVMNCCAALTNRFLKQNPIRPKPPRFSQQQ